MSTKPVRSLCADTETTGFSFADGDRIVEIGLVELIDRKPTGRVFHRYVDPGFEIPEQATKVHGLTRDDVISLGNGQVFSDIAQEMIEFIDGGELIFHNAPFDMGFLDGELKAIGRQPLSEQCRVFDTLRFAGVKFPGQRNNLNALCKRYGIDNSARQEHGALLDAQLLTEVYLSMTRHQTKLDLGEKEGQSSESAQSHNALVAKVRRLPETLLPVSAPSADEALAHNNYLKKLSDKSGQASVLAPVATNPVEPKKSEKPEAKRNRPASPAPF